MISTDFNCLLFKVVFVAVSEHGTSSCDMFLVGQARTKSLANYDMFGDSLGVVLVFYVLFGQVSM